MPRPVAVSGPAAGRSRLRTSIRSSEARTSKGALMLFFAVYAAALGLLIAPDGFFLSEPVTVAQD
jgi:hypothetical protein